MCDVRYAPTQIPPLIQVDAETHFDPLVPKSYVVPAVSKCAAQYPSCSDSVEQRRTAVLQQQQQILARIELDREERRSKRNSVSDACAPITESQTEQQQQQQEQEKELVEVEEQEKELVVISSSESSPQLIPAREGPQDDNRRRSVRLSNRFTGSSSSSRTARMQCSKSSSDDDADLLPKQHPATAQDGVNSSSRPRRSCKKKPIVSSSSSSSSSSGSSDSDSPGGYVSTLSVSHRGFTLGTCFEARTVEEECEM